MKLIHHNDLSRVREGVVPESIWKRALKPSLRKLATAIPRILSLRIN